MNLKFFLKTGYMYIDFKKKIGPRLAVMGKINCSAKG